MTTSATLPDTLKFDLHDVVRQHFAEAHQRVPDFCRKYLLSSHHVVARHWRHRRDIPGDLLAVPRMLGQGLKKLVKKDKACRETVSGKEQALLAAIETELLRIDLLAQKILELIADSDQQSQRDWQQCETLLMNPMSPGQRARIKQFLLQKTQHLSGSREGSRDLLTFLLVGTVGSQLAEKVTFGSAVATGSSLAGSLYIAQQSWWYGTWLSLTGVPGWVSWAGAAGGLLACVVIAPVLSPFAELAINHIRGEKFLHNLLDEIERQSFQSQLELIDAAGVAAGFTQIIPDLFALLKHLKV